MSGQAVIEVSGVRETINALKAFEPDLKAQMDKVIRSALNEVKAGAQSRYPKGDWVVRITSRNLLGTIAARGGGTRGKSWGESSGGIRAAIFEFAGTRSEGKTPQARATIDSLNRRYGSPGRFLWDSWDANGERALDTIRDAVLMAEERLQAALNEAGESF